MMNKKLTVMMATIVSSVCLFAGCGNSSEVSAPAPVVESTNTVTDSEPFTKEEKDILGRYILGIDDRAILEGAKGINLLARAESMQKVVTEIDVDDSAVDTTRPGKYKVKYTVMVDVKNLEKAEAYIEAHPEVLAPSPQTAESVEDTVEEKAAQETIPTVDEEVTSASQEITSGEGEQSEAQTEEDAPETDPAGKKANAEVPAETTSTTPAEEDGGQSAILTGTSIEAPDPGTDSGQTETVFSVIPIIPDEVFYDGTESASGNPSEANKKIEVVIEKDVTVVTPEEAVEIIESGGEVWTDENKPATVEDIISEESSQTATTQSAQDMEPAVNKGNDKESASNASKEEDRDKESASNTDKEDDHDNEDNESSGTGGQFSQSSSSDNGSGSSHIHNWTERTETVYHDEQGHYETVQVGTETVVDEDEWDEEVYDGVCVCSACGYETSSSREMGEHVIDVHDNEASWGVVSRVVDTIHHPAVTHEEPVYEDRWVVDREAWSEEKVVSYYCTECGATK